MNISNGPALRALPAATWLTVGRRHQVWGFIVFILGTLVCVRRRVCAGSMLLCARVRSFTLVLGMPRERCPGFGQVNSSIRFVFDSLKVHHDTLRYLGMYLLISYEDYMK